MTNTDHDPDDDPNGSPPADLSVADPDQGRSRLLTRQCDTCIFRPGNPMDLSPHRLHDIVEEARSRGSYIICHDTLPYHRYPHARPAICRGFHDRYTTPALETIRHLWGFTEIDPPT